MKATKFFALGGFNEIGKTHLVVEHKEEIVLIDAGIKFAEDFITGIDGLIPDYTYLKENEHKIKGLFITHGHLDHIGAIPFLLREVKIPVIYTPKIALPLIKKQLKEYGINADKLNFVEMDEEVVAEFDNIKVDFWTMQHSIPDSFGIRVRTPDGSICDTGDFRIDYTPIIEDRTTNFKKLKEIGAEGVDLLISDSTNAMRPSHSPSELEIFKDIEKFIVEAKKKVVVTTFASNLGRIEAIIKMAVKHKKKVLVFGRSMQNGIDIARKIGYITAKPETFVDPKNIGKYDEKELLILSTGSQGEERAALSRMAEGKHPKLQLGKDDMVIFSSSPIPGNRMQIEELVNKLYKAGCTIKENRVDGNLHTSGHAYKEEHMTIFDILKPKHFIPYHGDYVMGLTHINTAIEAGVPKDKNFIGDNGDVFLLEDKKLTKSKEFIDPGPVYIDGKIASKQTTEVMNKRKRLGENGFLAVSLMLNKKNNSIAGRPRLISRGTLYVKEAQETMQKAQKLVHGSVLYTIKNKKDWTVYDIKKIITERLEIFFYKEKRRKPLILPTIIMV